MMVAASCVLRGEYVTLGLFARYGLTEAFAIETGIDNPLDEQ